MTKNRLLEKIKDIKVGLSHDWLTGMRGGERVLEILSSLFPTAPIYTLFCNKDAVSKEITKHQIKTSFLQYIPCITKIYRNLLFLFPTAAASLKTANDIELLISTSHCVAKGVKKPKNAIHICYCFTPMRYAWLFFEEYFGENAVKRTLAKPVLNYLRKWDCNINENVSYFLAISKTVQERIRSFYKREAEVIYPPIKTDFWMPGNIDASKNPFGKASFDIVVSALVPYKRIDLVIEAYTKKHWNLLVVGTGPEYKKLKKMAGESIVFLGKVSDEELRNFYRMARILVFPSEEDFGLVPLEAQACGKPVVAFRRGGTSETILDGKTGILFEEQTIDCIIEAVERTYKTEWEVGEIRKNAEKFSEETFIDAFLNFIINVLSKKKPNFC